MKIPFAYPFFSLLTGIGFLGALLSPAVADSLWNEKTVKTLFSDRKASNIGDIITVIVEESNSSSKNSSTKTEKKTGLDASVQNFVNGSFEKKLFPQKTDGSDKPTLGLSSQNKFEGKGQINNSGRISTRFAVRVVDVLPNDNLIIEGVRRTSFSGESQTIVLRGTLRPQDISPGNTVFSYNLADVSIRIDDSGVINDGQKKGWFTKLWGKVTPF